MKFSDEEDARVTVVTSRDDPNLLDYDLMSFIDVAPVVEISVDIGKSVDIGESVVIARSDVVDNFGMRDELRNVAGTEDAKQVFHDMQDFLDMTSCDQSMNVIFAVGSGGQPAAAAAEPAAADCNRRGQPQPAESAIATATALASHIVSQTPAYSNVTATATATATPTINDNGKDMHFGNLGRGRTGSCPAPEGEGTLNWTSTTGKPGAPLK